MGLEDELQLPPSTNLPATSSNAFLQVSNGSAKIELSQKTSLRTPSRCLLVGRQAATADIRLQHGSISRKHAVLYFDEDELLTVKDLGGKHGTHVNGERIQGSVGLNNGDEILFGNVQESIFKVVLQEKEPEQSSALTSSTNQSNAEEDTNVPSGQVPKDDGPGENEVDTAVPVTRQDREAQIAAMVASFDATPTYKKFETTPVDLSSSKRTSNIKQQQAAQKRGLPIAQEFHIESTTDSKTKQGLTALVVDKSGSRFAVGHGPYLKLYDFSGMDRKRTVPFKTIIVEEGYTVEHLCYSNTGDRVLVGTASPQPTILDRDGEEVYVLLECSLRCACTPFVLSLML